MHCMLTSLGAGIQSRRQEKHVKEQFEISYFVCFPRTILYGWLRWNSPNNYSEFLKKKGGKDQESIQSSTTPDPGYFTEKWQKRN